MRKIAEGYTREILGPQLNALGVKDSQTCLVTTDVHLRLNALLSYHPGHPTLQTLLATAKEEASFYLPQEAPLEIRALTVLAVRNSLLEDLHTHRPYILMPGRKPLTDQQMEEITISAIKYISHEMPNATPNDTPPQDHLFRHFPMQYPFAWNVLSAIAGPEEEKTVQQPSALMPDLDLNQHTSKKESTIVSGIAPTIEPPLARQLTLIRNGRLKIFMVDSFKMLTRNTEKLFMVINFVIANGATFLTQNYYLAPTSAARRRIPIRPAHTETEMWQHFQDTHGLTPVHADALKRTLQQATLVT